MARPMPRLAPVTKARLPASEKMLSFIAKVSGFHPALARAIGILERRTFR
jgi:hypothetical protein